MRKKSYAIVNLMPSILTPPNPTYLGKEIPVVVTTTAGVYVQSGQSVKTSYSKAQPKSKK